MLEELRIYNFAIIDRLELAFASGLNVITGETGAGKSIIVDAVDLLLGGKSDTTFVRSGADRAVVEGLFVLDPQTEATIVPILQREDLLDDDRIAVVVLSREIRANGRSTARVNGVTISMELLKELGATLVDVHGQSEHLSLLKSAAHVDFLDRFADLMEVREALAAVVMQLFHVRREIAHLLEDEATIKRRVELLKGEIEQIDDAALQPGEDDELRAERNRLSNSAQLANLSAEALALLHGTETADEQLSAVDQMMQVATLLHKLAQVDTAQESQRQLADEISAQMKELASSLRRYGESVEHNPVRLNEVEERLELLNRLRKRFGGSVQAVLDYAERARAELEGIENSDQRLIELRIQETSLLKTIGELAERISRTRAGAAKKMSQGIVTELADLRMAEALFEVSLTQAEDPDGCFVGDTRLAFDETGIDDVEFMMSANPGEPLRPLAKVASGGEAARIMLALKRVLTQADPTPTLIFDEIDQGIGGRVGSVVGEKLWSLTEGHQVLVVTHLAQLAGYADRHYRVTKLIDKGRTRTDVIELGNDERVAELAEMLGARGESGRQSARELIGEAEGYKRTQRPDSAPIPPKQQTLL